MREGRYWPWISALVLALSALMPEMGRAQQPVTDGLACLTAMQNSDGSWGDAAGTGLRDTTVVLDTLGSLDPSGPAFFQGLSFLQSAAVRNQDSLARQIASLEAAGDDLSTAITGLLAGGHAGSTRSARTSHAAPARNVRTGRCDTGRKQCEYRAARSVRRARIGRRKTQRPRRRERHTVATCSPG